VLAAFDSEAIFQLVVLVLLGSGGMVKKFMERKRGQDGEAGVARRRRSAEARAQRSELEEGEPDAPAEDPWQIVLGGGDLQMVEDSAVMEEELFEEEVFVEPAPVEESVVAASAPTPEVSIEGPALGMESVFSGSFDQGTISKEAWNPGERIRESVFKDIEQSVSADISEHIKADMGEGVRGEATVVEIPVHTMRHARRGWRDAVVAAEALGAPLALRDSASLPAGLRSGR